MSKIAVIYWSMSGNTEYRRWRKMKNQQYHYLCLIEELRKRLQK